MGGQNLTIEWKTLGDIAFYPNERICTDDIEYYVGVENLLKEKSGVQLSTDLPSTDKVIKFTVNDILIGNIRPYLKKIWLSDTTGGTNGDVVLIRLYESASEKILPRYLYLLLASDDFFAFDNQYAKGAKMPRGDKSKILTYRIPVPPIKEQERIVDILDRFEKLTNDITEGLPAEIKARQQQYEYYRNKLLTFKQKISA